MPLVSVIIPTLRRPALVGRAVHSVLAQTMADLELVVILEGPDPATASVLRGITDPRLRVMQNERPMGAGPARNKAALASSGPWLAFLDDDDEWLPEKLERQLAAAGNDRSVLVTCRARVITPRGAALWPRRLYDGQQPVDEYLFDRRSMFRGDTILNTSSFLLPRALFEATRFGSTAQNEDNTLLLRVTKAAGGRVVMLPEPLVVLYKEEARESLGSVFDWRAMLAWADGMGPMLTRRAYAGFCLVYLGSQAARQMDGGAVPLLLRRAFGRGAPRPTHLMLFASFWLLPARLRQRVRAIATGRRAGRRALA